MIIRPIDLSKSVYELCKEYPDLPRVLDEIGFHDIIKPGMLPSVGRFMTIPKGSAAKNIDMGKIRTILYEYGYEIINE